MKGGREATLQDKWGLRGRPCPRSWVSFCNRLASEGARPHARKNSRVNGSQAKAGLFRKTHTFHRQNVRLLKRQDRWPQDMRSIQKVRAA